MPWRQNARVPAVAATDRLIYFQVARKARALLEAPWCRHYIRLHSVQRRHERWARGAQGGSDEIRLHFHVHQPRTAPGASFVCRWKTQDAGERLGPQFAPFRVAISPMTRTSGSCANLSAIPARRSARTLIYLNLLTPLADIRWVFNRMIVVSLSLIAFTRRKEWSFCPLPVGPVTRMISCGSWIPA